MLDRRKFLASAAAAASLPALHATRASAQGGGTDYDVLIIGGGVAGLAAAATLLRLENELKVLVLEGRDRLGGRVHSITVEGVAEDAELGARYLEHPAGKDWPPIADLGLMVEADAGDRLRVFPGMSALVRKLAAGSEGSVQLNSTVTEVLWRQGIVGVYYRNRGLESAVTARRIICTVPAPLLLAESPRFAPGLPIEKQAALLELTLDTRITSALMLPADALSLDSQRWFAEDDAAAYRVRRIREAGDWLIEVNYRGGRAEALSGQPPELLQAMALRDVGKKLSQSLVAVTPIWAYSADWTADNLSLGAVATPTDPTVHARMSEPLNNTLFFASDTAVRAESAGTVHGAYASGVTAGEAVLQSLRAGVDVPADAS